MSPRFCKIKTFIQASVCSHHEIIGVVYFEGYSMIIDMFVCLAHAFKSLSSIVGHFKIIVSKINPIKLVRTRPNFLVIMRSCSPTDLVTLLGPTHASISTSIKTALFELSFNSRINNIRVLRRNSQSNFTQTSSRKAGF